MFETLKVSILITKSSKGVWVISREKHETTSWKSMLARISHSLTEGLVTRCPAATTRR